MSNEPNIPQSYDREYSDDGFWLKLRRFAKVAGQEIVERALCLYYAAQRPDAPAWAKAIIYSALGYLILPLDAIPDLTPAVGFGDDLGALMLAVATVASYIDQGVRDHASEKLRDWFDKT
jgi:uncharacterized membrane protein YkvA (DUF1232 family)